VTLRSIRHIPRTRHRPNKSVLRDNEEVPAKATRAVREASENGSRNGSRRSANVVKSESLP
jgi:hypothetical protein